MKNSAEENATHSHAIVWLDHLTAKVFRMGLSGVSSHVVHAHLGSSHLHHKANTIGSGKVQNDQAFLAEIAKSLDACTDVLVTGPGTEKRTLNHYLESKRPSMKVHVESSDHPSDDEIIARGRKHFGFASPRA